ncbi:putative transcriptional regulatory protein for hcr operon [Geobacter sp. OR-1]|uniref:MarR family winged helix-turn-helix transcriptional regulator n=1 Tax=Geobacter sp. OR-1 TaxID=1266765 RepID=UPI0005433074|nr:MarR family winged helix-turn-helix transcriptional regulator [Geobacter sp. OR-1]GAM10306.1 putative transcriptional regulatory protein for hcr operon [Geobacter sp. OR-1]
METVREQLQIFTRRFGLLNASCCDSCCGEDVSIVQSHILFEVRRAGNPSMQQVAEELGIDITTFSRQVKTLETRGLIAKEVSPGDRRVNLLKVTDKGLQVLTQIDRFMEQKIEQIFSAMTEFERITVTSSLKLLNDAVTKTCC